jgi:DNA-binding beta-propeller fold protein YncE
MFICGSTNDSVFEYALTSGFNVSTASFIDSISVASEEASPFDIAFNPEGNKMFIAGATGDAVYEYILSAAFDISTAVYSTNFSVAGQEATIQGIAFNESGTKFYITGSTTDAAYQYSTTAASTTVPAGRALSSTSILLEG